MNLEIIFAEFGENRQNNNNLEFPEMGILDPTYSSIKQYFPNAKLTCYTDNSDMLTEYDDIEIHLVDEDANKKFDKSYREGSGKLKWGFHCCDYYQIQGLLNSKADVVISMDSDLMFTSDEVKSLIPIIKKFGICAPTNERQLVKNDGIYTRGNDGDFHIF